MGDRCDDCTWMKHSEWILRSVESLQDEQEKQGALLREIGTNIRIVVKVAKALGYLLGIVGSAGAFDIVKRLLAALVATGAAAAIIYFG